ncbi:uncharacterized protein LY89DRAFT_190389 [Mollisia scopiformis]|uniref:Aminoglycoside phosphotransferase domain-containing protein n=1 Tax=Mollisia scopiformis TaxID=149040 RepID=A0A194WXI5_MOLSC|nr:uncharacterized protein LY89DRAFT_190389 [Mollisia scopiformis]KUJ12696.1 hypothetical protein LY89DRAFT_190389 [Mollisia scopiformis]
MPDEHAVVDSSITDFFLRSGLTAQTRHECFNLIEELYPNKAASAASCQGYCSLTVFVGHDTVVQFRPYNYRLDLQLTLVAREVYGTFAPETRYVATLPASGLLVYRMGRIGGVSFKDFRASRSMIACSTYHRAALCRDFARFLARSWKETSSRALPLGLVGKTIESRLRALVSTLSHRFRLVARRVLENLRRIEALPWVLTHGDIVASNIMIEPSNGTLTGLVDWAEAERLPFGVCFYGLEELLGEMTMTGFQYRHDAVSLRTVFWAELGMLVPELQQTQVLEAVKLARDLGVLLWHGIAFDDGAIDRVVQEGRDVEEIHRLEAFLDIQGNPPTVRSLKL